MATTQPIRLTFSVIDELGTRAAITEYGLVDPAMTVAQLEGTWAAQAALLDAILGVQIIGGGTEVVPTAAQIAAAVTHTSPDAGSRVEQTGVFNLFNAVTPHRFGIAVAGLSDTFISAGRIVITEGNPVDLWLDAIELASAGAGFPNYTNNAQQQLTVLADAFLSFRKRRKQLSRSSREEGPD